MHYIVGLGNPGSQYENTRHNIGFTLVERFVAQMGLPEFVLSSKFSGRISEGIYKEHEIALLLPETFMNASGGAVKKLVPKGEAHNLILIYDDVDIPIGELKVSFGRGDGGHNGVKSVIEALGSKEFARVRIGVARKSLWTGKPVRPKGEKLSSHVLGAFSTKEQKQLESVQSRVNEIIAVFVTEGIEKAMQLGNQRGVV